MRLALALLATGLGLSAAAADPARRTAAIDIDGVEVRSGPAMRYPAVGEFRKGDTVLVVREDEGGFLAIQPPPGSVSWVRQIHLGKVEMADGGKANVPVAVEGAEVLAGSARDGKPTNRVTARLPKGTIVEVTGPAVRVDNASYCPITPPEGDLRWIPRTTVKGMAAVAAPPPYKPVDDPFTVVGTGGKKPEAAPPAAATLPAVLTDHRLWAQASRAEKDGDYATARAQYARIYQDLWDQKADRDALVICFHRYTRCDEIVKKGAPAPAPAPARSDARLPTGTSVSRSSAGDGGKWSSPGYLQEMQMVKVDGQTLYALHDDRGQVMYYVTAASGLNLRTFNNRRVQLYGVVSERADLYRPHLAAERVEVAK